MDADYSVELGADAPALELPWTDPEGKLAYIDLRRDRAGIELIPEAQQFPALRKFLVDVNAPHSQWQTAKCDVWTEAVDAAENLYGASFAQSCYVDLVLASEDAPARDSLPLHERLARQTAQSLDAGDSLEATAEIVVRRCYFHREPTANDPVEDASDAGYCLTLYVSGFGTSPEKASAKWELAMGLAERCLLLVRTEEERAKGSELS